MSEILENAENYVAVLNAMEDVVKKAIDALPLIGSAGWVHLGEAHFHLHQAGNLIHSFTEGGMRARIKIGQVDIKATTEEARDERERLEKEATDILEESPEYKWMNQVIEDMGRQFEENEHASLMIDEINVKASKIFTRKLFKRLGLPNIPVGIVEGDRL